MTGGVKYCARLLITSVLLDCFFHSSGFAGSQQQPLVVPQIRHLQSPSRISWCRCQFRAPGWSAMSNALAVLHAPPGTLPLHYHHVLVRVTCYRTLVVVSFVIERPCDHATPSWTHAPMRSPNHDPPTATSATATKLCFFLQLFAFCLTLLWYFFFFQRFTTFLPVFLPFIGYSVVVLAGLFARFPVCRKWLWWEHWSAAHHSTTPCRHSPLHSQRACLRGSGSSVLCTSLFAWLLLTEPGSAAGQ